jgi:hypothetical protein
LSAEGEGEDAERHRYLVRWVIRKRIEDRDGAYRWLRGYVDQTGRRHKGWNDLHPNSRLERDVKDQWEKGNRGEHGEWK